MHILAPAQPHIRAALKIAACVLISLLFVICGLLFFVEGAELQTTTALI